MHFSTIQVKEYKDELINKAEALITTGFPEKIVQLNELLATQMFADRNFHDVYQVSIVTHQPLKKKRNIETDFCLVQLFLAAKHSSSGCR